MPTWLVHGFRWPRAQVRIHTILQNLDDVAPEWVMAPATQACLHQNFQDQWPEIIARLPDLRFIEQYDPEDLTVKDQPYAYVCDLVHEIKLGIDIDESRGDGVPDDQSKAIAELRDKVTPDAKLGWFVVVNGDVERWAPPLEDDDELADEEEGEEEKSETKTISPPARSPRSSVWTGSNSDTANGQEPARPSTSRSMKNWIGGMIRKTRSSKSLRGEAKANPPPPVPPLPALSPKVTLQPAPTKTTVKAPLQHRPAK
ncbi:hypothetical protein OPT61_g245 [Boeremia exigua]|uniref:Uncharacterized protein n=1 Tax=Boeremia exigua TaxID=749465 RepID=A0ACC2IUR6_9PLEO|nr:hypothetical protein OPT61_g245 [Boeremia exigua]